MAAKKKDALAFLFRKIATLREHNIQPPRFGIAFSRADQVTSATSQLGKRASGRNPLPGVLDQQTLVARQENRPKNDGASKKSRSSFSRYPYPDSLNLTIYLSVGATWYHCKWHECPCRVSRCGAQAVTSCARQASARCRTSWLKPRVSAVANAGLNRVPFAPTNERKGQALFACKLAWWQVS